MLISLRKVTLASTPDATRVPWISVPSCSTTPRVEPSFTRIFATSALVRISAPFSRAAAAIELLMPPMPPRTYPHTPRTPSHSPIT